MVRLGVCTGLAVAGAALLTGCWKGPSGMVQLPPPVVTVVPAQATLTTGRSVTFAARVDGDPARQVAWSVVQPGGGTVDNTGTYQAPAGPGVFTVRAAVQGVAGTAKVTVVAPPAGAIQAPSQVLAGAGNQTARIEPVPGSQYLWSITGGSITAGTGSPAVVFTAGNGPKVILTCKVTSASGDKLDSSLEIPVAAPVSLTISPANVTLTAGRAMKFGFNLEGGTTLGVVWTLGEPGCGSLDAAGRYVAPVVPGLYTVRVAAKDDPTKEAVAQVKVVPAPPQGLFAPDSFFPGTQGLAARVLDVPGMTYAWSIDGGTLTSDPGKPEVTFTAGSGPDLTLRCRITNEAGDSYNAEKVIPGS